MMNKTHTLLVATCLVACFSSQAATIITPNVPTLITGGRTAPNAGSSLEALVNGVGLSATVTTGSDTAAALLVTHGMGGAAQSYVTNTSAAGETGDYFATGGIAPVLLFDLGGTYDNVDSIIAWNYVLASSNNATQFFSLAFFSDSLATSQIGSSITGLSLAATGAGPNEPAQQVFFGSGIDFDGVRSIQMTLTDNYGGNRVGLGEVRFSQQAIPEPSRTLLFGFACLALLLRRRR